MHNAVDVDDGRAMHACEATRIELSGELAESGAMDDAFRPHMQCHAGAGSGLITWPVTAFSGLG
jgi:hypothetical protein